MSQALENLCGAGKLLKAEAPDAWRVLDKCHNTRNLGEYEGLLDVDEGLVADLIAATQKVSDALDA